MGSCRNSNSLKNLCMSLLPARMKKIQSKIKSLEWSQHFSHYIYGDISRNLRAGKSALQSMIGSDRTLNSSETLWLSSLPENEEDPSKLKALVWSQDYMPICQKLKGR